jgi:hypothetical protein
VCTLPQHLMICHRGTPVQRGQQPRRYAICPPLWNGSLCLQHPEEHGSCPPPPPTCPLPGCKATAMLVTQVPRGSDAPFCPPHGHPFLHPTVYRARLKLAW